MVEGAQAFRHRIDECAVELVVAVEGLDELDFLKLERRTLVAQQPELVLFEPVQLALNLGEAREAAQAAAGLAHNASIQLWKPSMKTRSNSPRLT